MSKREDSDAAHSHFFGGPEEDNRIKRTYKIRPDQDLAMTAALTRVQLGEEQMPWQDRSRIIEALLDEYGLNQSYIDGERPLGFPGSGRSPNDQPERSP